MDIFGALYPKNGEGKPIVTHAQENNSCLSGYSYPFIVFYHPQDIECKLKPIVFFGFDLHTEKLEQVLIKPLITETFKGILSCNKVCMPHMIPLIDSYFDKTLILTNRIASFIK